MNLVKCGFSIIVMLSICFQTNLVTVYLSTVSLKENGIITNLGH